MVASYEAAGNQTTWRGGGTPSIIRTLWSSALSDAIGNRGALKGTYLWQNVSSSEDLCKYLYEEWILEKMEIITSKRIVASRYYNLNITINDLSLLPLG